MEGNPLDIVHRKPVIGREGGIQMQAVERSWRLVTEVVRRDIIDDPKVRSLVSEFTTKPVSETLADEFIKSLSVADERIGKLCARYQKDLGVCLALPPVPDEFLAPDLSNAETLVLPEEELAWLERFYGKDSPMYSEGVQLAIKAGVFLRGITRQERLLVARRYAYSRDVKLLALGAEILEQGSNITPTDTGEIVLPSRVKILIDESQDDAKADLLKPHLWEKRKQLKDRVYEIYVNGKKYLLKEKKTARHTDTKKGGHQEGQSSAQEFATSKQFQEKVEEEKGDIKIRWEKPVGFATYPDGFQFAIFEFEEGLIAYDDVNAKLTQEILNNRDQFREEYERVALLAKKYQNHPTVTLSFESRLSKQVIEKASALLGIKNQVSFEDFALVKGLRMSRQACGLMKEAVIKMGYENSDLDGYAFKVHVDNGKVQLEIVGFDFEYYSKIPEEYIAQTLERRMQFVKEWESRRGVGFLQWGTGHSVTRMQKAVYFAMLEREGLLEQNVK